MTVKLFGTKHCPGCDKAKQLLDKYGAEYEYYDLEEDQRAAMVVVKMTRQRSVPVVQIGNKFIVGYNAQAIEEALNSA